MYFCLKASMLTLACFFYFKVHCKCNNFHTFKRISRNERQTNVRQTNDRQKNGRQTNPGQYKPWTVQTLYSTNTVDGTHHRNYKPRQVQTIDRCKDVGFLSMVC